MTTSASTAHPLGGVEAVEAHVVLGEVGAPGHRRRLSQPQVGAEAHLPLAQQGAGAGLVEGMGRAQVEEAEVFAFAVQQPEGQAVQGQIAARVAQGGHHPPPVGVGALHRRLDAQGAHHLAGGAAGVGQGGRPLHRHLDEAAGALGVQDHGPGQVLAGQDEGLPQGAGQGVTVLDGLPPAQAVGQQHHHVVGAGVRVHVYQVEGGVHRLPQRRLQEGLGDGGVGGQEAEHGGHVGVDHAGALGHPAQAVGPETDGQVLGAGVGGHDGQGEVAAPFPLQSYPLHRQGDLLHGQVGADDAGGGHHHVLGRHPQATGSQTRHLAGVLQAAGAGGGIGAARVGDDRLGAAIGQVLAGDQQGGRLHAVAGVDGGRRAGRLGVEEPQVVFVGVVADAGMGGPGQEAGRGGDAARFQHLQVVAHGRLLQGYRAGISRPMLSGKPSITFMFWMACPAAPFTRLSMALTTTSRPAASSRVGWTRHRLLPRVCLVEGGADTTCTKGSSR